MTTAAAARSHEEEKFDRQLRLWGAEGQQALQSAHVLVLGASATASELLKNMVLPNLGRFTIVDDAAVTLRDLGNNFFLEQGDIGQPIAPALVRCLCELNGACKGAAIVESPAEFARSKFAEFGPLESVTLAIVAAGALDEPTLVGLSAALERERVPLMYVETNGLLGLVRIQAPEQNIIHTHPDPETEVADLRALNPFPELREWFAAHDPDDDAQFAANIHKHSHIPWPCIVYHALQRVRRERIAGSVSEDESSGAAWMPATGPDFRRLREEIDRMMRRREPLQEAFVEAKDKTNPSLLVAKRETPELAAALADPRAADPAADDHIFWFLMHGLRTFRQRNGGVMPATGNVPDMTALTEWFTDLQAIFRTKAAADAAEVAAVAINALARAGRSAPEGFQSTVRDFCKNAWNATSVKFTSIAAERARPFAVRLFNASSSSPMILEWYAALRAARLFRDANGGRFPGDVGANVAALTDASVAENDEAALARELEKLVSPLSASLRKAVSEVVHGGGGEPNAVASIVGAVAAQEAIKLIQRRRVPTADAIVFDGIVGCFSSVLV